MNNQYSYVSSIPNLLFILNRSITCCLVFILMWPTISLAKLMISGLFQGYPNAIGELWGGTWESERAGIGQNERYGHWGNFNYQSSNLFAVWIQGC